MRHQTSRLSCPFWLSQTEFMCTIHVLWCCTSPHSWSSQSVIFKILCNHSPFIIHHTHHHTTLHTGSVIELNFRIFPHSKIFSANIESLLSKVKLVGGCIADNIHIHTLWRLYEFSFSHFHFMFVFQMFAPATWNFLLRRTLTLSSPTCLFSSHLLLLSILDCVCSFLLSFLLGLFLRLFIFCWQIMMIHCDVE